MSKYFALFFVQPGAAWVVSLLALLGLICSWLGWLDAVRVAGHDLAVMALCLVTLCVVADIYPVHVTYHTKVSMTTVLLYLMAVLLTPPVAGLAAGLTRLVAELLERHKRGSFPSDIVTGASRWALVVMLTSWIAHLPQSDQAARLSVLVLAAVVMFVIDVFTLVFELAPMSGDSPKQIIVTTIKTAGLIEAVQYNLSIVVALAVGHAFWELGLLVVPFCIAYQAFKNMRELRDNTRILLESLADAVDLRDPYTGGHSRRVTAYCESILDELGLRGPDVDVIVSAARVHDIGKIGIPDAVLNKPGKLTEEEWAIMAAHAARGADLLARYANFARGVEIVRHHHERWDGKGYPAGLAGTAIPFGARVIAVADSFDAMTSDRPYRRGMAVAKALDILRSDNGQQWDAKVVNAFLRSMAVARLAVEQASDAQAPTDTGAQLAAPV